MFDDRERNYFGCSEIKTYHTPRYDHEDLDIDGQPARVPTLEERKAVGFSTYGTYDPNSNPFGCTRIDSVTRKIICDD